MDKTLVGNWHENGGAPLRGIFLSLRTDRTLLSVRWKSLGYTARGLTDKTALQIRLKARHKRKEN